MKDSSVFGGTGGVDASVSSPSKDASWAVVASPISYLFHAGLSLRDCGFMVTGKWSGQAEMMSRTSLTLFPLIGISLISSISSPAEDKNTLNRCYFL